MKAKTFPLLLAALVFALAAPAATSAQQQGTAPAVSAPQTTGGANVGSSAPALSGGGDQTGVRKYQLGPGDVLDLRVFGEPQFSGTFTVNDEGNLEVPFVDEPISALCRTDIEIKKDVVKALEKYIKKPQVSLRVAEMRSRPPAVIFGAVRNPTPFQLNRRIRLLDLMARTGGATEQAGGDIHVYHTEPLMCPTAEDLAEMAKQQAPENALQLPFTIYKISDVKEGKIEANPYIRPGDIVIVQEAAPVYITGAVVQPSNLYLRNQLSLTRAIAQVGGLSKEAKPEKVRIIRTKDKALEPEIITVNFADIKKQKAPDIALQPYDIVEVSNGSPWSLPRLPGTLLSLAMGGAQQVVMAGAPRIIP
ncbi:MAG TPA: polysaccharide biosynthesis/export family protein [Pyrinomonadaceae bacterium]|nr:polysaccharide biosynthesis/export family protein [Pyrinomonadaceae bacterium]